MTATQPDTADLEILPSPASQSAVLSIDLSASINAAFLAARTAAASATDHARAAITAAVDCGDLLLRQKASLPHVD